MTNLLQDFILEYKGYGIHDSKCRVRFFDGAGAGEGKIICVMTELDGNPGTSVTNAVERIASEITARFKLAPEEVIWVEHYEDRGFQQRRKSKLSEETFDEVRLAFDGKTFSRPRWRRLAPETILLWTGQTVS